MKGERNGGRKAITWLMLGLIGAHWSQWFCVRWKGQECMWRFTHMHPGAVRARAHQPHTQLSPAENCCVQLLHFPMANQPSALQKSSLGAGQERVFAVCGTQELCPIHRVVDQHWSGGGPPQAAALEDSEKACLSFLQQPCASLTLTLAIIKHPFYKESATQPPW